MKDACAGAEILVMLKYPNFRLKFRDVTSFNQKSGYLSTASCSGVSCPSSSLS